MNIFRQLWEKIINQKSQEEIDQIDMLEKEIKRLEESQMIQNNLIETQTVLLDESDQKIMELQLEISSLKEQLAEAQKGIFAKLYEHWYNKYPKKSSRLYRNVNVIKYTKEKNLTVPKVTGSTVDEIANNALKYVKSNVTYTSDNGEYWQYADETIARKKGDCEDGAILMYNIMRKSGVPKERIRLNAGDVKGGGHAYITYLRESNSTWYVLDWCYWYSESVNFKRTWDDAKVKYFGIWFSWNEDWVWEKPGGYEGL